MTQPSGTVTLVFTDVEGSTRLLEELGTVAYREALARHRDVVRTACGRYQGYEVDYEGDAFFYAFQSAADAVSAVGEFMAGLQDGPIRIRVGIHTGEPALDPPKYVGLDVHRAARVMAAAHGGQVVLTRETVALLADGTDALKDLGEHRFKDLGAPERCYQLLIDGLEQEFPRLKSLYHVTLPVPATPFLGRETELATVVERLTHPDTRLLTLTGPGGTGKTRLALQAAAEASERYPDGTTWIALAPLRDPALAIATIAQALDIREQPGEALTHTIARTLLDKKTLLLLDNAEHLLPPLATDLATLLEHCPTLTLLATSRERLQIAAENELRVPTLSTDDALTLFGARAKALDLDLLPDQTARELVERLDRLPLAIELAAARLKLFTPYDLLERLGQRLDLLKGHRDTDPRQQTLRATIDWSYELLTLEEQRVYRALSVFAGGCTLDAAQHVTGTGLDTLQGLLDKSLIRRRSDPDGHSRYWMLETIRQHAEEELAGTSDADIVRERFCSWVSMLAGVIDEDWIARDQAEWLDALEAERPNVMAALAALRAAGRGDEETALMVAAGEWIDARGPYQHFVALFGEVSAADTTMRGRAAWMRARLLVRLGRFADSRAHAERARALGEAAGDRVLAANALNLVAWNLCMEGNPGPAMRKATRALEQAERSGSTWAIAQASLTLADVYDRCGDPERALELLSRAVDLSMSIGDLKNAAAARGNHGATLLGCREPDEVLPVIQAGLDLATRLGDTRYIAIGACNLAIALAAGGDAERARDAARRSLEAARSQGIQDAIVENVAVLALAAAADRDDELAITLWSAWTDGIARIGYAPGPEITRYVTRLLEPLRRHADFELRWRAGEEMSLDKALELGLAGPSAGHGLAAAPADPLTSASGRAW